MGKMVEAAGMVWFERFKKFWTDFQLNFKGS